MFSIDTVIPSIEIVFPMECLSRKYIGSETLLVPWLQKNCRGAYNLASQCEVTDGQPFMHIFFEREDDAIMFSLVWR